MKIRTLIVSVCLAAVGASPALAARKVFVIEEKFPFDPRGLFILENPVGDITVQGTEASVAHVVIRKTIEGKDAAAIEEGRRQATVIVSGDERRRVLRASIPPRGRGDWSGSMSWSVHLPKTASLRVVSQLSRRIQVSDLQGHVHVKNFTGNILLEDITGPVVAESVNGSVQYQNPRPRANVMLTSVNGSVTAAVAPDADLRWIAETLKGQIRTNLPARGAFIGVAYRSSLNAPGGPTITTSSLTGNIWLLRLGETPRNAQLVNRAASGQVLISPPMGGGTGSQMQGVVRQSYTFETNLGDVRVQEIRGDADISTGAGEVQIGLVSGACKVRSLGGPLMLGEILGSLSASTRAGDILVDSARRGGSIRTQGGTIELLYTSGSTELFSGGGDIHVRQAAAAVNAVTRSGDITINVDAGSKSEAIEAATSRGNVILNVSPQFGANVEATIVTDNPESDVIESDLPGLSISREAFDGKTRIRATGKLNGGGERVILRATGGDIRITTRPPAPTVVTRRQ